MRTYKNLEALKKRCIKNEEQTTENLWNDEGIKVENKIYRQMEYGTNYVTFRNTGKKGRQPIYANRNPLTVLDTFITIKYRLLKNEITGKNDMFSFIELY